MTLLELLVKELPQRGGWPEGAFEALVHDSDNTICRFYDKYDSLVDCISYIDRMEYEHELTTPPGVLVPGNLVTKKQYEYAIAAQQPAWNGEGLPPVGVTCEAKYNHYSSVWFIFECVGVSNGIAFGFADGAAVHVQGDEFTFRPIRTESDRKREDFVSLLMGWMHHATRAEIEFIYDKIAAGKIPGVELSK